MHTLLASLRISLATLLVCVGAYTLLTAGFARAVAPESASGSLLFNAQGQAVGSRLIAQGFTQPGYFWPRPSAVDYNAAGAGGSNKSPTSADLHTRATALIERYGATAQAPMPAELVAASGSGLDPHITEHAALYQAARVATARHLAQTQVEALVHRLAYAPGGPLTEGRIVNVLELNLALDQTPNQTMDQTMDQAAMQ